jgi:hypothetical protein
VLPLPAFGAGMLGGDHRRLLTKLWGCNWTILG